MAAPVYMGSATQFTHTGLQNGVLYAYRLCPVDAAGNLGSDASAHARPAAEFMGPSGSVVINANEPYTRSVEVALALTAQEVSGVTRMCISNSSTCTSFSGFAPQAHVDAGADERDRDSHLLHTTLRRGSPHVLQQRKDRSLFSREQTYRSRVQQILDALPSGHRLC